MEKYKKRISISVPQQILFVIKKIQKDWAKNHDFSSKVCEAIVLYKNLLKVRSNPELKKVIRQLNKVELTEGDVLKVLSDFILNNQTHVKEPAPVFNIEPEVKTETIEQKPNLQTSDNIREPRQPFIQKTDTSDTFSIDISDFNNIE